MFRKLFDELVTQLGQEMWREEKDVVGNEVRLFRASPSVTITGNPDFHHPSPEPDVEEETMCLSWKQILRLLTRWDPFTHYSNWLSKLQLAMDVTTTAHKMLAMRLPQ